MPQEDCLAHCEQKGCCTRTHGDRERPKPCEKTQETDGTISPDTKEKEGTHHWEELGFCLSEFGFYSVSDRELVKAFKQCLAER